jgi:tRNA1(Val) A37 N6-methylase TrmN6
MMKMVNGRKLQMSENCFKNAVGIAKNICMMKLKQGDIAVDATMGNGHDTMFLSNIVGDSGKVYAFDIQKSAIENTKEILEKSNAIKNVVLINDGHENIDKYIDEDVKLIMFNLGYLPKGDHSITTKWQTTLTALKKSLNLIEKNGVVILVIYYGHFEGKKEKEKIEEFTQKLDQKKFNVLKMHFINQINNPPELIIIERR